MSVINSVPQEKNLVVAENDVGQIESEMEKIANFSIRVSRERHWMDEGKVFKKEVVLEVGLDNITKEFKMPADEFQAFKIMKKVHNALGSKASLSGTEKQLRTLVQKTIPSQLPTEMVSTSVGLTDDGNYLSVGMLITPTEINTSPDIAVDISGSNLEKNLGFLTADDTTVREVGAHIIADLLNLKGHDVTFPVIAHVFCAPFSSAISKKFGWQKPILHLVGSSGVGKTSIGLLCSNFYGSFKDPHISWSSTASAIECFGHYLRDAVFLIDDLKNVTTTTTSAIRIIQNSADNLGRARLKTNSDLRELKKIRGSIISTGEDFPSDVDSAESRCIILVVGQESNQPAMTKCKTMAEKYRALMPYYIKSVLSQPNWEENMSSVVEAKKMEYSQLVTGISNANRISLNWAINSYGFLKFVDFMMELGVIDQSKREAMTNEYEAIVRKHLKKQAFSLMQLDKRSLVAQFLSEGLGDGSIFIEGMGTTAPKGAKMVGKKMKDTDEVAIFPALFLEAINRHYNRIGQKISFTLKNLKNTLTYSGMIKSSDSGRLTDRVRYNGLRFPAWRIALEDFKKMTEIEQTD